MQYIKPFSLNESWWNMRKYLVDTIEDEDVEEYDYDELKKISIHHMKMFSRYRTSYFENKGKRRSYYFGKSLKEYHNSVINIYRLFRLITKDDEYPVKEFKLTGDNWFNDTFRRLATKFHGTGYSPKYHSERYMIDIEHFLNRMTLHMTDETELRYCHEKENNGYIRFLDKIEVEKEIEEHKDIDPFGEENWTEEDI